MTAPIVGYVVPPPRVDAEDVPLVPAQFVCACGRLHEADPANLTVYRAAWAEHLAGRLTEVWRGQPEGTPRPTAVDAEDLPLLPAHVPCPHQPDVFSVVDLSESGLATLREARADRLRERLWLRYREDPVVQAAAAREAVLAQERAQERAERERDLARADEARDRFMRELVQHGLSPVEAYAQACQRFPEDTPLPVPAGRSVRL